MKMTSKKLNKRVVGVLILVLTAVYLFATAAIAQEPTVTAQKTNLVYSADHLSWGDVWSFDEAAYASSLYAQQNGNQVYNYYNTSQDTTTSSLATVSHTGSKYYGKLTTTNKGAPTGTPLNTYLADQFYSGISSAAAVTAPIGLEGETIPVVTTQSTGVYSVVPGSTGTYRIYVYSPNGVPSSVKYALLESWETNNSYASQMTTDRTFTPVADTGWYYTELTVHNLSWSAYSLTVQNLNKSDGTQTNSASDEGVDTYTGTVDTVLNTTTYYHFYNKWTATPRWYNTVLAISFGSSVQLGPITKTGDSLTVTNAATADGTITALNIFGEPVTFGTNYHMPVYFAAEPSSDKQFSALTDSEGNPFVLTAHPVTTDTGSRTFYEYDFQQTAVMTALWEKQIDFASVKITGGKTSTLNYYQNKADSHSFEYGVPMAYTFTADFTNAVDAPVQYTVTRDGVAGESGTLTAENPAFTFTAQWETAVVTFQSTYEDTTRTMTFTVAPSTNGKTAVAKIGSTEYYFLEDALEAATSGNTVVLLRDYTFLTENRKTSWGNMNSGPGYTVDSGVKLIVPYAASYAYNTSTATTEHTYACETKTTSTSGTGGAQPGDSNTYMTLTVPTGVTLHVASGGVMSVGGTTNGVELITGSHADVCLQNGAAISVDGVLSSCGFIYGGGKVYGNNGGSIYVPFTVHDFRGGSYVVGAAGKLSTDYGIASLSGENAVTPFMRYSFLAIQCMQRIEHGCSVIAYADMYANDSHNNSKAEIIGTDSSSCLIALAESSYLEISYDGSLYASTYPAVGKMYLTVYGDATYGGMTLEVDAGFAKATVDTRNINFVLPYNFDLRIASGTFSVPNSVMLLPGAGVTVDEGATLDVSGKLTVYDGLHDYTCGATTETTAVLSAYADQYPDAKKMTPSSSYPSTTVLMAGPFYGSGAADLIVNGTLNLKSGASLGGVVQTNSSTNARIFTDANIGTSTKTQIGVAGYYSINLLIVNKEYAFVGATVRELPGQILDTATGDRINIQGGLTYYPSAGSDKIDSYTFDVYYYWTGTSGTASVYDTVTENVNMIVAGSWYNYAVPVYTVLDGQIVGGAVTTYFAHGTDLTDKGYYTNQGLTTAATSVTGTDPLYFDGSLCQAQVNWADGSDATLYPTVRSAIKAAVNPGDRVVVLKDLTGFSDIIAPADGQDFIFDLNGHTMEIPGTAFTNQSAHGNMTVDLNGGTVISSGTPTPVLSLPEGSSMTLDLNGGTIQFAEGYISTDTVDYAAAAIINGGNLVITDSSEDRSGRITSGLVLDFASNLAVTNFSSLIRNTYSGELDISNVNLEACQAANTAAKDYGTVIFNGYGASMRMTDVKINSGVMYGIYNFGGTIESIQDGSLTGKYGIYNMNIRSGAQNTADGYQIDYEAKILDVSGVTINVTQYGIYNRGAIGTIGGTTTINATSYAVYNDYNWYQDAIWNRYVQTDSGDRTNRTYYSDVTADFSGITPDSLIAGMKGEAGGSKITVPFIAQITGSASLNATATSGTSHSVYNRGYIGRIIGNASITTGYRNALSVADGGYVGLISGNATLHAVNQYALYIAGNRNLEYTSTRSAGYKTPEYEIDYPRYTPSRVNLIHGGGVTIGTDGSYAIQVSSQLGSISGNVAINAKTYGIAVSAVGPTKTLHNTKTWVDGVETNRKNVYSYYSAAIGSIGASASDNVTITTTGAYGINNAGEITAIGPGTTISSSQYAVQNTTDHYNALTEELSSGVDESVANKYLTKFTRTYHYLPATIGEIDGASITTTSTYAIRNYAHIGAIRNASISSGASDYTIANISDGVRSGTRITKQYYLGDKSLATTTSQFTAYDAVTMDYAPSYIGSIENCELSGKRYVLYNGGQIGTISGTTITASGERAINNIGKARVAITYEISEPAFDSATGKYAASATATSVYEPCSIDTIAEGNTIQATTYAVFNSGHIGTIDSGTGDKTRLLTTSTGTTNAALYNYQGLQLTSGYVSAYIGTIENVEILGDAYGIRNGDGNANYTEVTIDKIGEGVVAVATRSNGYALHNNDANAIIGLISGGDYYSGAKSRNYAIYKPDEVTNKTYPEGYVLSSDTREAQVNETPYNCYYVGIPAHVHTYGEPEETWTVDEETGLATLSAAITCQECEDGTEGKVLSETVTDISGTTSPGDCLTKGGTTYTATVTLNAAEHEFTHFVENEDFGDHSWSEWSEVTAPTCTKAGEKQRTCSVCSEVETEEVEAAGHSEAVLDTENSVSADCVNPGKNVFKCPVCGIALREEETSVKGHGKEVLDTKNSVSADCETPGKNVYKCPDCGIVLREEETSATGHNWVEDENAYTAPSCTAEGSQGYICLNNGNHTKTEPIAMIPHTYRQVNFAWTEDYTACKASSNCGVCGNYVEADCQVESEPTEAATETQEGVMTHTASVTIGGISYSDVQNTVIPMLGHNYVGEVTTKPTCEEPGEMTYTCQNEVCTERTYTEEIPATGHSWQKAESEDNKDPTCEEPGSQYYVCSNDASHTKTEEIEATGHSYTGVVTKEATCSETGIMTYTCANDPAHTYTEDIPTLPHSWSEWSEVFAPTCTEAGQQMRACSVCGEEEIEEVAATGHSEAVPDTENSISAECEKDGLNVFKCPVCGVVLREEIVTATGHSWEEVESAYVAPTCEDPGSRSYVCKNDESHEKTEQIPATGHSWVEEESVYMAPTCEDPGSRSYVCQNDASHKKTESIPSTGHSWNQGEVINEADCANAGTKLYTCGNDPNHTYTEEIPALGHSYSSVVTPPTCTAPGYTTHTCPVCGESYTGEETPALGHSYTGTVTVNPTCTDPGIKTYTCSVCGDTYEEAVPVIGHGYSGTPEFHWTEDYSACTAIHVCGICGTEAVEACVVTPSRQEDKWVYTASTAFGGVSYQDTQEVADVYSVTITWDQTYTASYSSGTTIHIWDPRTMTYSSLTEGNGWTGYSRMEITLDNTGSNNGVVAFFRYDPFVEGDALWNQLSEDQTLAVAKGGTGSAIFTVDPTGIPAAPGDGSGSVILGQITITLEKEILQDGNVQ